MNALARPKNRYVATLVAAVLFAVAASLHSPPDTAARVAPTAALTAAPAADAVRLPEIVVRATPEERAAALATPLAARQAEVPPSPFLRHGDARASGGGGGSYANSPRMNFDMPYYAFGKMLPRAASRE